MRAFLLAFRPFRGQARSHRLCGPLWKRACPRKGRYWQHKNIRQEKGANQAPHKRCSTQQIQVQSSNAIASALHASIRAQSPFLIQLLSSIQVPPTHITLGWAM